MVLKVTRRTMTVELILDQDKAEEIVRLGRELSDARNSRVKVEGGNTQATKIAERIESLRAESSASTLSLTLMALPYSKWARVLSDNTPDKTNPNSRDLVGMMADAIALMTVKAEVGGTKVPDDELSNEALHKTFDEMTDGQITVLVNAVFELNTGRADPKAAFDLASKIIGSSRS